MFSFRFKKRQAYTRELLIALEKLLIQKVSVGCTEDSGFLLFKSYPAFFTCLLTKALDIL